MTERRPAQARHDFLAGGGEMGERMRAHDWAGSPLGAAEAWPQSLKTAASIMLNSGHPMFLAWGRELGFLYNDAYALILGDKHPDALGRPFEAVWADIWADILPLVETAMAGQATWSEDLPLRMFRRGYWEDTWWTFSYSPVRDETGGVGGMFCACTEQTERVLGAQALRENAERLRLVQAAGHIGSFDYDMLTGEVHRSPEYLALQGLAPDVGEHGVYTDAWLDRVHPEDRERVLATYRQDAARGGAFDLEYRILRPSDGALRWIHNRGRIDLGEDGQPVRLLSVQTDVTDRKNAETRQQLLIHELNHRVKNTLAAVQSIAAQTLRNAGSLEQARGDFESRLMALSRTHDILTRETWEGADLAEIVAAAARPYGDGRVRLEGPAVHLPPQPAVSIAMALHELATNAAKYGALSTPEGRVEVAWTCRGGALTLTWREAGGPPVAPPARRGFGARLIEHGLARELNGRAAIDYAPSGVVCTIEAPLG